MNNKKEGMHIKAPEMLELVLTPRIFLAGSIEQGRAEQWQQRVADELKDGFVILNPRRDNWDDTIETIPENNKFREQVYWELEALEKADVILMYFDPETSSPISLLEFGLYVRSGKLQIVCPEGYKWRGNVILTAKKYNAKIWDSLELALLHITLKFIR